MGIIICMVFLLATTAYIVGLHLKSITIQWKTGLEIIFQPEEYVTSSVLEQGVFDSRSLTLVIGANILKKI
jgi:hypothetical protein